MATTNKCLTYVCDTHEWMEGREMETIIVLGHSINYKKQADPAISTESLNCITDCIFALNIVRNMPTFIKKIK